MAIPATIQEVIRLANIQSIEELKLETLKSRKSEIQSELALINDQITTQNPIVVAARQALKAAAAVI